MTNYDARGAADLPRRQVGSRAGARTLGSGGFSTPFVVGLSPAPIATFPAPAASNPACGFSCLWQTGALGCPVGFSPRVMRPVGLRLDVYPPSQISQINGRLSILNPPSASGHPLGQRVFAGCGQSPSAGRRLLLECSCPFLPRLWPSPPLDWSLS